MHASLQTSPGAKIWVMACSARAVLVSLATAPTVYLGRDACMCQCRHFLAPAGWTHDLKLASKRSARASHTKLEAALKTWICELPTGPSKALSVGAKPENLRALQGRTIEIGLPFGLLGFWGTSCPDQRTYFIQLCPNHRKTPKWRSRKLEEIVENPWSQCLVFSVGFLQQFVALIRLFFKSGRRSAHIRFLHFSDVGLSLLGGFAW